VARAKLVGERVEAEILDPRRGFERVRTQVEQRRDPLTGHGCRLLPAGSIPPPARHDLERLAAESRESCPFCAGRIERETPRFPPEVVGDGRIRSGAAVLFPNLVPYAKWSSVSVYSPELHLLRLDELTPDLLADNLATQVEFARAVLAADPASRWVSVNANHLPPSGSSVFHPHLQGSAHPAPTSLQRLLAELPPAALAAYLEAERDGERWIAEKDGVEWLAAFAPVGPAQVRAFVRGCDSPERLEPSLVGELARGIAVVLGVYAGLGFESFNLALAGAPGGTLSLSIVARAYYGAALRSDAMWSERLHWEAATDVWPEQVAERLRATQ
jgi:UDPglucose--hexose-1-phosphate uridylyltransferase